MTPLSLPQTLMPPATASRLPLLAHAAGAGALGEADLLSATALVPPDTFVLPGAVPPVLAPGSEAPGSEAPVAADAIPELDAQALAMPMVLPLPTQPEARATVHAAGAVTPERPVARDVQPASIPLSQGGAITVSGAPVPLPPAAFTAALDTAPAPSSTAAAAVADAASPRPLAMLTEVIDAATSQPSVGFFRGADARNTGGFSEGAKSLSTGMRVPSLQAPLTDALSPSAVSGPLAPASHILPRQDVPLTLPEAEREKAHTLKAALGERLQLQIEQSTQKATIRLDPPHLGKVDVSIHYEGGKLQVHIQAAQPEVYRALQQVSHELRGTLSEHNSVAVNVQISQQQSDQKQNAPPPPSLRAPAIAESAPLDETEARPFQHDHSIITTV